MRHQERYYPESRFAGFTDIDGTLSFYLRVNALLKPESRVLDIGCGRGAFTDDPLPLRKSIRIFQGKCASVLGIDVDPAGAQHPYLDEFRLIDAPRWPVEDGSVDLCVSDYVLEHIADPAQFFSECGRVLAPGGLVCLRTSNIFSYVGLAARLVPNRLHTRVLAAAKERVNARDIFPTLYRCNTVWALRRRLQQAGFNGVAYGYASEPGYLAFSGLAYWLGVFYQRFAPGFMQPVIHVFAQKA